MLARNDLNLGFTQAEKGRRGPDRQSKWLVPRHRDPLMHRSHNGSARRTVSLLVSAALASALIAVGPATVATAAPTEACPWVGSTASPEARASQVLAKMTLDEKLAMTHGSYAVSGYAGSVAATPRLCIPALTLNDGGAGVVMGGTTSLPAPIAAAATWDVAQQYAYGKLIGSEAKTKGVDVNLGPNVNLVRDPRGGRAFETSGEDPYLTGTMATEYVKAVQSEGVMADVKHLAVNDVEQNRNNANSVVDERTLNEIYYPAFKMPIQEGEAASTMAATSMVNGVHANENTYLMKDTAKEDWGFEGFVVTDWDSARSTVQAANAQLDLNMPNPGNFGQSLSDAVRSGDVSIEVLNDKIVRILTQQFKYGMFDTDRGSPDANATSAAHTETARDIAAAGTVLMKNDDDLLPLDPDAQQSIVVIGEAAKTAPITGGGGSSHVPVSGSSVVSIVDGISSRAGDNVQVDYVGPWTVTPFATASAGDQGSNMLDGDLNTRWTSGAPMAPGQSILLDMGSAQPVDQITLDSAASVGDYARGYEIYLSADGSSWGSAVASGTPTAPLITASFTAQTARYIKVVQTGSSSSWWSIAEFKVYKADGSGGQAVLSGSGIHVPGVTDKLTTVPTATFTSVDGKPGLTAEYFNNLDLSGDPVLTQVEPGIDDHYTQSPGPGVNAAGFSVRWTGTLTAPVTGTYTFSMSNTGGIRMMLGGESVFNDWAQYGPGTSSIHLVGGVATPIKVENYQPINTDTGPVAGTPTSPPANGSVTLGWLTPDVDAIESAAAAAAEADVAVVVVNDAESEDGDRQNLTLPGAQDDLVAAVAAANPNTVVVLNTGAPVLMPWLSSVSSVVESWYGGQENGNALASILFGDVNPSGKLPQTWPTSMEEMPTADTSQYPGDVDISTNSTTINYSEGLDVGYRWYDSNNVTALFPFGFGLSYTNFSFSDLTVSPVAADGTREVKATVTNTGTRTGAEVAQLYLSFPSAAGEPPNQLRGYERVSLAPQESKQVTFTVKPSDLQIWDSTAHDWSTVPGDYQVHVGDSSENLPLTAGFTLVTTAGSRSASVEAPDELLPGQGNVVTSTFSAGGTEMMQNLTLGIDVPEGWTAVAQTPVNFTSVAPTESVQASWLVTPLATDHNRIMRVAATANADGGYSSSNGLQVTVGSTVKATLTSTATQARVGTDVPVNLALSNVSDAPVDITYTLTAGTGVTLTPATGTVTVPAAGSVNIPVVVSVGTSATKVTIEAGLEVQSAGSTVSVSSAPLSIPMVFSSLAQAYGNVGVGDHNAPGNADFDGSGYSYSKQGLAAKGVISGQAVVHKGIVYQWPDVADGAPDNVVANGQQIEINQAVKSVSFLGAANNGNGTGTGTVHYSDGTQAPFTLALNNWTPSDLMPQDELVVTANQWNPKPGSPYTEVMDVSLYSTTIALDPTKTVSYLTLPTNSTSDQAGNQLHLFDMQVVPAGTESNASTIAAVLSPAAAAPGSDVTAAVTVSGSGAVPTGTVTMSEGVTLLATKSLVAGKASIDLGSTFAVGTHQLNVSYGGDTTHEASTTAVTLTVATAPTVQLSTTPATPNGANGWYTVPVTLSSSAFDQVDSSPVVQAQVNGSSWTQISPNQVFDADGTYTVTARAVNAAGVASDSSSWSAKIDATKPVSNADFNSSARTLTFTAADSTSGVARVEYQQPGGEWTTSGTGALPVGPAAADINYRAVDVAGNVEATRQISVPKVGATLLPSSTLAALSSDAVAIGGTVTMSVKVAGSSATPTGVVRVVANDVLVGQATLVAGKASLVIKGNAFVVGNDTLQVNYDGDSTYASSSDSVTLAVKKSTSVTKVSVSPTQAKYGSALTATARVSAAGVSATGIVTIKDGKTVLGSGRLVAGMAIVKLPTRLSVGTHALTAVYGGDTSVDPSSGAASLKVAKADAKVKTRVKPKRVTTAKRAKIVATVTSATSPMTGIVTAKVTRGKRTVANVKVRLRKGKGTLTLPRLAAGRYKVAVKYQGNSTYKSALHSLKLTVR